MLSFRHCDGCMKYAIEKIAHSRDAETAEELSTRIKIDNAVQERFELVIAMKLQLIKHFNQLSDEQKESAKQHVNKEFGFMLQFLKQSMPFYEEMRERYLDVLCMDYSGENVELSDSESERGENTETKSWMHIAQ